MKICLSSKWLREKHSHSMPHTARPDTLESPHCPILACGPDNKGWSLTQAGSHLAFLFHYLQLQQQELSAYPQPSQESFLLQEQSPASYLQSTLCFRP